MNSYIDSSLYDILGIDKNSNLDTIKKAYINVVIIKLNGIKIINLKKINWKKKIKQKVSVQTFKILKKKISLIFFRIFYHFICW